MTWEGFLADYERKLIATEAALDAGDALPDDVLGPFVPPTDLGPMPATLEHRAIQVLERNVELEQRLRNGVEVLGRELGQATRMSDSASRFGSSGTTTTPSYIDRSV